MTRRLPLALILGSLVLATPAAASVAPGVVAYPATARPVGNVDAGGASAGVALPDGSTVLAGAGGRSRIFAMRLGPTGMLDTSFGSRGTFRISLPGAGFGALQVLRRPDGRLLLVTLAPAAGKVQTQRIALISLTAAGALDTSFGRAGVATTGIQAGCGGCSPVALAPDGTIVVTGATGDAGAEPITPSTPKRFSWVVGRFDAAGAPVASFGQSGLVTLTAPGDGLGQQAHVSADGRIVLVGSATGQTAEVRRLTAAGNADPAFNGGAPVGVPGPSLGAGFTSDGTVDLTASGRVTRIEPDGRVIPLLADGAITATTQLLELPGRAVVAYGPTTLEARPQSAPALSAIRIAAGGTATRLSSMIPFAGGLASFCCARHRVLKPPSLGQNAFVARQLLARTDGSFVLIGGLSVVQYSGEGAGRSAGFAAAAGLDGNLQALAGFGGTRATPTTRVSVPRQRARTARTRRYVSLRLTSSAPGLALVNIRDRTRRVLFSSVVPVYAPGTQTVRVSITSTGIARLRRGGSTPIQVSLALRDIVNARARATARGTLR